MYDKLIKGYLKNSHILKYFLKYEFSHFQKVCMNTSSMCAPSDMNTYPMCDLQALFFGFKYIFCQHTRVFE